MIKDKCKLYFFKIKRKVSFLIFKYVFLNEFYLFICNEYFVFMSCFFIKVMRLVFVNNGGGEVLLNSIYNIKDYYIV